MSRFRLTAQAHADVEEIWAYVAQDNVRAADALVDRLREKYQMLARYPELGPRRSELGAELRSLAVGTYIVFYRPLDGGVEIARVLSGYRDLEALFGVRERLPSKGPDFDAPASVSLRIRPRIMRV